MKSAESKGSNSLGQYRIQIVENELAERDKVRRRMQKRRPTRVEYG